MSAMRQWVGMAVVVIGFAVGATGQAIASSVVGELWLNQTAAAQNATIANAPITTPDAVFTAVNLDYRSELQTNGYTVGGFLKNPTFFNTSAAFSPSASLNNTYFLFTGQTFLNAGNNSFVVGHDDGVELNFPALNGGASVVFAPGGTVFSSSPFTVNAPTAGLYDFKLSFGEAFGCARRPRISNQWCPSRFRPRTLLNGHRRNGPADAPRLRLATSSQGDRCESKPTSNGVILPYEMMQDYLSAIRCDSAFLSCSAKSG